MKIRKFFIVILIITLGLLSGCFNWRNQNICGPKGMGSNYDVSYCDKSCNTNDDCKFTCGCGPINRDEKCSDDGIIYDCEEMEVECKDNECTIK